MFKQVVLFTTEASFLSSIPTFSFGKYSIMYSAIAKPNTLSPRNSSFSKFF